MARSYEGVGEGLPEASLGVRAVSRRRIATHRSPPASPPSVSVFAGESARVWHAQQTCQRSGSALEIYLPARSLRRKLLEAVVLIASGLVILSIVGKAMGQ